MQLRNGKQISVYINNIEKVTYAVFHNHLMTLLKQIEWLNVVKNEDVNCNKRYSVIYDIYAYMNTHLEYLWEQRQITSKRFIFVAYSKSNELIVLLLNKSYSHTDSPQTTIEKKIFIRCIRELFQANILTGNIIERLYNTPEIQEIVNTDSIKMRQCSDNTSKLIYKCCKHLFNKSNRSEYDLDIYHKYVKSNEADLYDDYFNKNRRFRKVKQDLFIREFNELFNNSCV
jgi:hypothetical protein